MHRVIKAAAVTAALALAIAPAAYAKHGGGGGGGGGGISLPGGGGDLGGGGGGGGGGGTTTPVPGTVDLSGSWSGIESSFFGDRQAVLTLTPKGDSYEGAYTELITGDSPVFKVASVAISGQNVTIVFEQGGNAGLHPDVSLRATLSEDGHTLTGVFGTVPVTLTR
jgi:hypothetical protein